MTNSKPIIGLRTEVFIEAFYDQSGRVVCTILDEELRELARQQAHEFILQKMRSKLDL